LGLPSCIYLSFVCYHSVANHFFVFFFSSRRRHTRSKRDWSSDVCSSDLASAVHQTRPAIACLSLRDTARNCWEPPYRPQPMSTRSEERRVGKECRSRRSAQHSKKKRAHNENEDMRSKAAESKCVSQHETG